MSRNGFATARFPGHGSRSCSDARRSLNSLRLLVNTQALLGYMNSLSASNRRGRLIGPLAEPINRRWARSIGPYRLSTPFVRCLLFGCLSATTSYTCSASRTILRWQHGGLVWRHFLFVAMLV